jgi:ABC-type phosphate transport system substrate-binding protein
MSSFTRWLGLAAAATLITAAPGMRAQEADAFRVVVHPDAPVQTLTTGELSQVFLKRKTRWEDGTRAVPVDQAAGSRARDAFVRVVFDRSPTAMAAYWQQQIFSGRGVPPPELAGDQAVVEYVASHPGAIGYVAPGVAVRGVRIVEVRP